jgi:hypothetical protein
VMIIASPGNNLTIGISKSVILLSMYQNQAAATTTTKPPG